MSRQGDEYAYGNWYLWARENVSAIPLRAHTAAWTAFKASAAGRSQSEAVDLAKKVVWGTSAQEAYEVIEPCLRLYGDWLGWAVAALGVAGDAAHAAAAAAVGASPTGADLNARYLAAQEAAGLRLTPFTPDDLGLVRSVLIADMTFRVSRMLVGGAVFLVVGGAIGAIQGGPLVGVAIAALVVGAGAAGLALDRTQLPLAFFSFQGPIAVTQDQDRWRQYKIRMGGLVAKLDVRSSGRLAAEQKKVGRIIYHIRPSPVGSYVTVLRAEAPNGTVLYRDLRMEGTSDIRPTSGG